VCSDILSSILVIYKKRALKVAGPPSEEHNVALCSA
jgi:hypothetical protein